MMDDCRGNLLPSSPVERSRLCPEKALDDRPVTLGAGHSETKVRKYTSTYRDVIRAKIILLAAEKCHRFLSGKCGAARRHEKNMGKTHTSQTPRLLWAVLLIFCV